LSLKILLSFINLSLLILRQTLIMIQHRKSVLNIVVVFLLLIVAGCNSNQKTPDVKQVAVTLRTDRFDTDLFSIDTNNVGAGLKELLKKYPDFLNYFLDTVMAYEIHGNYTDTVGGVRDGLRMFLTYKDFVNLEDSIKFHYPDTRDVDAAITEAFKYLKYYFPAATTPRIIYLNMGLSKWPSFPLDTTAICVGLDMFLGDCYPFYRSIGVPDYMAPHMRRNYIPVSVLNTWYMLRHPFMQDERTLLDLMIQRGKEQYFLHKMLPQMPDSVLFGFTGLQLQWCGKNEADIYNFFVRNELLYNKESLSRFAFVNDGPFAQGMEPPTDTVKYTPGNIGSWLGYKIVSAYMNKYPSRTLAQLADMMPDPSRFLDSAHYRPR
jgi:hypothetical protein